MGRSVIVTGGASGIGFGIVEAALSADWQVAILDLPGAGLDEAKERLRHEKAMCLGVDVTDEASVAAAVDEVDQKLEPLAGIVNSAGIGRNTPIFETTAEQFRDILNINVVGTFLASREAARVMQGRGGAIVNITSVSGVLGSEGRVAYGSSKGAVNTMTKIMAVEFAPLGLRVNAVAPGPVDTPMAQKWHGEGVRKLWCSAIPMRRYGTVSEIVAATLFLLDDEKAGFVTGQTLSVDGGFTIAGLMNGPED